MKTNSDLLVSSFLGTLLSTPVDTFVFMYVCMTLTKRRDDTVVAEVHMVDDMEVDKVADKVVDMTWGQRKNANMELDMVADMKVDKVANKVADMVDDLEVDKVADMFKTKCIKPEMF